MSNNPTIDEVMVSEIKRDIAERYFGFRKLIEEDKLTLEEKIRHYSYILEKRISFDLLRIYVLLRDESIIKEFLDLIGLHQELFYDPYLVQSANIPRRVLACQHFRGFFRSSRFQNYIFDCYENLTFHTELYLRKITELETEQGIITEEIKQFYHNNDLSVIMQFLKSMGDPQLSGAMQGGVEIGIAEGLDQKLNITPPPSIEQTLTIIPPLKSLATIKKPFKRLIKRAYAIQPSEILQVFSEKETWCDRTDPENQRI
ncbi:MAG: hypothetical protein KJ950_13220 [Proteobacteria bacterium]|nr:hypothetical protein [Pseudomonadota bacterium]MBU1686165.1 hypothetical protein [Pseudomonadota bacterium]